MNDKKTSLNPSISWFLSQNKTKIAHIHVGKCAGETILSFISHFTNDDVTIAEIHVDPAQELISELLRLHSDDVWFVVPARDPVDRFISAFNWGKRQLNASEHFQQWLADLYQRIPSTEDLVAALQSQKTDERQAAQKLARSGHMSMGISWYLPFEAVHKLPENKTAIIEFNNLLPDLRNLLVRLKLPFDVDYVLPEFKKTPVSQQSEALYPTTLSPEARSFLTKTLENEYLLLRMLRERYSALPSSVPDNG